MLKRRRWLGSAVLFGLWVAACDDDVDDTGDDLEVTDDGGVEMMPPRAEPAEAGTTVDASPAAAAPSDAGAQRLEAGAISDAGGVDTNEALDASSRADASTPGDSDGKATPEPDAGSVDAAAGPNDGGTPDAALPARDAASADDAAVAPTVDAGADDSRRVFVTSIRYTAALGGIEGADAICMAHAAAEDLPGEFRAWLSTVDSPVGARFEHHDGPYLRLDGELVAESWEDLSDGTLRAPINVDESGVMISGDVWTGTLRDGTAYAGSDCQGFDSAELGDAAQCGSAGTTNFAWTENIVPSCATALRLYCFEQ